MTHIKSHPPSSKSQRMPKFQRIPKPPIARRCSWFAPLGVGSALGFGAWSLGFVVCALSVLSAQNKPSWPPAVHKTPEKAPVRSAPDEMKTLVLPPGYRAEL